MLDTLRWISDYFVLCHHDIEAFTAQVGDANVDHALWQRPEDITAATENRPSFDLTPSAPGRFALHQQLKMPLLFHLPATK